jgi:menaquinone-dependent protoporphyrinogen oxidase
MHILVTAASRHGSTLEIGLAIARELRAAGHVVDVLEIEAAQAAAPYEAAIVGSAIYMGSWLSEARHFIERSYLELARVPVWLFSSGPLGQANPQPAGDPAELDELMRITGARGHRIFVGKLDKSDLSLTERLITKVVKAPDGDFRDWKAIRGWAREIAAALPAPAAAGA